MIFRPGDGTPSRTRAAIGDHLAVPFTPPRLPSWIEMSKHSQFALKSLAAVGLGAAVVMLLAIAAGAAVNGLNGASTVGRLPVVDARTSEAPLPAVTAAPPTTTSEPSTTTSSPTTTPPAASGNRVTPQPTRGTAPAPAPVTAAPTPTAAPVRPTTTRPATSTTDDHHGSGGHGNDD
jgi:hypothetical protein